MRFIFLILLLFSLSAEATIPAPIPSDKFWSVFGNNGIFSKIRIQVFNDPLTGKSYLWAKYRILNTDGSITAFCHKIDLSDHAFADSFSQWGEQNLGWFAFSWNANTPHTDIGSQPWCNQ